MYVCVYVCVCVSSCVYVSLSHLSLRPLARCIISHAAHYVLSINYLELYLIIIIIVYFKYMIINYDCFKLKLELLQLLN